MIVRSSKNWPLPFAMGVPLAVERGGEGVGSEIGGS